MTPPSHPQPQFLQTRAGRLALLGMLALDVFVMPPFVTTGVVPHRVGDMVFAFTMFVAVWAMGGKHGRKVVISIAVAALLVQFTRFLGNGKGVSIADAALSAAALGTFAGFVLVDVFRKDPVSDRLIDVVLAYLLVGATFAFLYEIANLTIPGAVTIRTRPDWGIDYTYFSFTTMTAVGSGDVLPTHPVTKSLVMVESLIGQLYVAVLVARFVNVRGERGGSR